MNERFEATHKTENNMNELYQLAIFFAGMGLGGLIMRSLYRNMIIGCRCQCRWCKRCEIKY